LATKHPSRVQQQSSSEGLTLRSRRQLYMWTPQKHNKNTKKNSVYCRQSVGKLKKIAYNDGGNRVRRMTPMAGICTITALWNMS